LAGFQRWFSTASSRPLLPGNATRPQGIEGASLRTEANARLRTVGGMSGLERLEVYNRQYWFRLITIMQEEYPCALHVIGLDVFNSWVIRYLDAHPPATPYLAEMDREFPSFLRKRYRALNRAQALEAVDYDKAFSRAFDGSDRFSDADAVPSGVNGSAATIKWRLSPVVTPLWLHWNFTAYRAACREDEALTRRIPLRPRGGRQGHGLCVHRHENTLYEKPVMRAEFLLLDALRTPRTLDQVFRAAQKSAAPQDVKAMERHVAAWFRDWTELGWVRSA
jgi:hypothetical protein